MIGLIILSIYVLAYLLLIYPIYLKLVIVKKNAKYQTFWYDVKYGNLPIYASFLGLFWFLGMPFYVSYWLHNRQLPSLDDTKAKAIELENRREHYEKIRASVQRDADIAMREALRELDDHSEINLEKISRWKKSQWG